LIQTACWISQQREQAIAWCIELLHRPGQQSRFDLKLSQDDKVVTKQQLLQCVNPEAKDGKFVTFACENPGSSFPLHPETEVARGCQQ